MKKRYGLLTGILITVLVLFPIDGGRVRAAQAESDGGKTQIIFLLDASQSMKKEDHWTDAADSVCMISSALPEKYEAALLVYNAEIVYREDFGKIGQSTRDALEDIELGGYTSPAAALEAANAMFDADAVNKRAVFISDGEISMKEEEAAREALDSYAGAVKTAAANDVKIDMFAIPDEDTPNEVLYGTKATEGEVYTVGEMQTLGELSAKYLFDLLQIERIDLGEARTVGERVTVDLQDIYMKSARILLIADDNLQDFHVVGQCESISVLQGNKTAMAKFSNPMEKQVVVDYVLENRAGVHIYLMKEYELKASIGKAYTSEDGVFEIEADIINHQGKRVLDAENLKDKVTVAVDGKPADYRVEEKRAFIPYQTTETEDIAVDVNIDPAGCMIHFTKMSGMVKLTVPIAEEEKPDYTVLWAVLGALGGALILILAVCIWKSKKKTFPAKSRSIY